MRTGARELDDPVAIKVLKRFAADWYFDNIEQLPPPEPFKVLHDQKVAVIGAGPCGLTCAYFLAQMGYPVTVFEALPVGGGMLSVAIPDFRLPQEVINKEVDYISKRGVEIKYNTPININFTIDDLKKDGYELFLSLQAPKISASVSGSWKTWRLLLRSAVLKGYKVGKQFNIGRRVAVIGGGNVALDTAIH